MVDETSPTDDLPLKFKFNFQIAKTTEHNLDMKIEAAQARVDRLVDGIRVQGHPIIQLVLQLTREPDELVRLGKALERIGPYLAELDKLQSQKRIFELVREDPNWLMAAFGDFSDELEAAIDEIQGDDP